MGCLLGIRGILNTDSVYFYSCPFRFQHILDKYFSDHPQWEERAKEEPTQHHIRTGIDPTMQLTRAGLPASLKENIEVEHALDAFYAEMILWEWGELHKCLGMLS